MVNGNHTFIWKSIAWMDYRTSTLPDHRLEDIGQVSSVRSYKKKLKENSFIEILSPEDYSDIFTTCQRITIKNK